MTGAGYNIRANIWRIAWASDDTVGGAVTTGTLQYQNVHVRMQSNPEEQLILQQGLETVRTFVATVIPGTLDIHERDELEISKPTDHRYYGERFRITNVRYTDLNKRDPRNYLILSLSRDVRAHDLQ
jgi:hypothetical protein